MTDNITGFRTDELLFAGKRAMEFQEFLIRRAFGFFYGIWAVDLKRYGSEADEYTADCAIVVEIVPNMKSMIIPIQAME